MGKRRSRIVLAAGVSAALLTTGAWQFPVVASAAAAGPAAGAHADHQAARPAAARPTVAYPRLALPHGGWARVYSDGVAEVHRTGGQGAEIEHVPLLNPAGGTSPAGNGTLDLPARGDLTADLIHGRPAAFEPGKVVVVYRDGVTAKGSASAAASTLRGPDAAVPAYTSAPALNRTLAGLGVDSARRLFTGMGQLTSMHTAAQQQLGKPVLNFADASILHLSNSSVATAVARLRSSADVAYAEPDWIISTTDTPAIPVPKSALTAARTAAATRQLSKMTAADSSGVPANYDLTSSAQSMLNRPGDDVVPAFTELAQHGQLPGQGEIITNVSLGTLDDASAAANPSDPCNFYAANYGPTTIVQNGQRYIDWPSMPLIPAYTASSAGKLDPTGETCGDDPTLAEVGLDFSMMAPLPDGSQRAGMQGSGLTDLLGIAPGASYRLVEPSTPGGAITDVDAAFLAAAAQTPRPDVITASLGFGLDQFGYSSRYLEDDPLTQAVISAIVQKDHIVVCVSAGDGLRTYTNAAVPPSGGAVATNLASSSKDATSLTDVEDSDAPSRDVDSGAIDVGGTTLDDIFAAPPGNPANTRLAYWHAFPATRYDGGRLYASGFGSRVNVSAPGDSVLSFSHPQGGGATAVEVDEEGGTSASAPQVAAAAAVVLQAARLAHHQGLLGNPLAVRKLLEDTGAQVPAVPQSDTPIHVGPQLDLGQAVQTIFASAGHPAPAGVARVAVEQRQQGSALGGSITTATDPASISLTGRLASAWITISPDWTGLPGAGLSYRLSADAPGGKALAATPWARLQPSAILSAAGLPMVSAQNRTVALVYTASAHGKVLAQTHFTLTFGPWDGTVQSVPAPVVPSVVRGSVIPVRYDTTGLTGATDPILVVSHPGRVDSATGLFFRPAYTAPLTGTTGTIDVPVSALPGAGIYGIGIQDSPGGWFSTNDSAFTFIRVALTGDTQPPVPTLSAAGSPQAHYLEFPYNGSFQIHYNVSNVPGANGAVAEFSAPGPTTFNNYSTFNNPNGSERDDNGGDTGSVAYVPLHGVSGAATLNGGQIRLDPAMNHTVRVLATRNGQVTGEASGIATIEMDGVRPTDNGSVAGGFGVSETGSDGFITSSQETADGSVLGSVQPFNQNTAAVGKPVVSKARVYETAGGGCAGMFSHDTGLYDQVNPASDTETFHVLDPVASGKQAGTWSPPDSLGSVMCTASDQADGNAALLSLTGTKAPDLKVSSTNVAADTFSKPVDLTQALSPVTPVVGGFAQDTATGQAAVAYNDLANFSGPPAIALANLTTGQVTTIPGVTSGTVSGLAVDSSSQTAAAGSFEGFGLYHLGTGAGTLIQPGGSTYQQPAADPVHGEFLVEEVASPDEFGGSPNNNSMSSVLVTSESGAVLKRIEAFNFYNIYLLNMGDYLQLNPATSTAFALGPGGTQLYPFHY